MREVSGAPNCMGELVTFHPLEARENKREKKKERRDAVLWNESWEREQDQNSRKGIFLLSCKCEKIAASGEGKCFLFLQTQGEKKGKTIEEIKKKLLFYARRREISAAKMKTFLHLNV